jgi:hypothetical protein
MPNKTLEIGQTVRREVLGSHYVDHRAATAWPFTKPHPDLLTEYMSLIPMPCFFRHSLRGVVSP